MNLFVYIILMMIWALIPAAIAKAKGYNFFLFYVISIIVPFIIMLIITLALPRKDRPSVIYQTIYIKSKEENVPIEQNINQEQPPKKTCPNCGGLLDERARICVYCHQDLM